MFKFLLALARPADPKSQARSMMGNGGRVARPKIGVFLGDVKASWRAFAHRISH